MELQRANCPSFLLTGEDGEKDSTASFLVRSNVCIGVRGRYGLQTEVHEKEGGALVEVCRQVANAESFNEFE